MADSSPVIDRCDQPSYSVLQYIQFYGARLDGVGFVAIRLVGNVKKTRDLHTRGMRNTAVGVQIKRW